MAADLTQILSTAGVGAEINTATGNLEEAAYATGYAAWIVSVTGTPPAVVRTGDKRVSLALSPAQKAALGAWLDRQVGTILTKPAEPPVVDYNLGATLGPWAIKYTAPVIIGAFLAGWLARWLLTPRKGGA